MSHSHRRGRSHRQSRSRSHRQSHSHRRHHGSSRSYSPNMASSYLHSFLGRSAEAYSYQNYILSQVSSHLQKRIWSNKFVVTYTFWRFFCPHFHIHKHKTFVSWMYMYTAKCFNFAGSYFCCFLNWTYSRGLEFAANRFIFHVFLTGTNSLGVKFALSVSQLVTVK